MYNFEVGVICIYKYEKLASIYYITAETEEEAKAIAIEQHLSYYKEKIGNDEVKMLKAEILRRYENEL